MSFVAIDLGASNTRYRESGGHLGTLTNGAIILDDSIDVVDYEPYSNSILDCLDIIIEKGQESKFFPVHVLMGSMAERYDATIDYPSIALNKVEQQINYVSAIVVTAICKLAYGLDDDIRLYIAIPPLEVQSSKEVFKQNLVGSYTVKFPRLNGGTEVKFNITGVNCSAESSLAVVSYLFDDTCKVKDTRKGDLASTILSIDIGASTTDLAVFKNGHYLEKSGDTYKYGCNVIREKVVTYVRTKYGYDLPDADANSAVAEGRLKYGAQYVDISNVLKQIKRAFAKELFKQMQTYFRKINMPLKLVDTIVVSGGGSMQSQYIDANNETQVTSEPVSYYLAQELQKLSEATRVEYYGDTPRFANISGLYIKALVAESKMAKPVTQPVVQPMNQTIGASQTVVPNADTGMGMGFPVNPVM